MTELLPNHLAGRWQSGDGPGTPLTDPVLGTELVRVSREGLDLAEAFDFAREHGGAALRALTYRQRAALLAEIGKVLQAHHTEYHAIALANAGTTPADAAIDIDGGLYTLGQFARWGERLGDARALLDGGPARLGKDPLFQAQHVMTSTRGVALFINAFNFPSWGLWEKAAPALLSGVPVIAKPATATAWLTQRMVRDVIDANILPPGALSVVCGSSAGLLDPLQPFDLLSFTGSAETAALLRRHPAVAQRSVRTNIEADSLNSALLAPDARAGSPAFDLLVSEVVREMTVKAGQKCTAIRRVFVPRAVLGAVGEAISAKLARLRVGNPRNDTVRMGSLVSRAQWAAVQAGVAELRRDTRCLFDGSTVPLVDADPAVAACIGPTLLQADEPALQHVAHQLEVFGPCATLMPYDRLEQAWTLARQGQGSLVASVFSDDTTFGAQAALALGDSHGRVHAVTPDVGALHTGHGNVMPMSLHGGPGRAGGGEELGGLRALAFYHRRSALQASTAAIEALAQHAVPFTA